MTTHRLAGVVTTGMNGYRDIFARPLLPVPIVYSESYYARVGDQVFPTSRYRLLKQRLSLESSLKDHLNFVSPGSVGEDDIREVHSGQYVEKLKNNKLDADERARLGMPISGELFRAISDVCGGTLMAAKMALDLGAAVHLGGGFHHAFPDHGEGFCVLNDIAISIKALRKEGRIKRALVVDCDLHQGNGTAFIFREDPDVFTFSIHQESGYPFKKENGDMDIGLRDYTGDREYLGHVREKIPAIISVFKPELIMYLAGADPYMEDRIGTLNLSKKGLRQRDNFVIEQARNFCVPIAITLGGGYSADRRDTIDISFATVEECVRVFCPKGEKK